MSITVRGVTLLPPARVGAGQMRVIVPVMANDLGPAAAAGQAGDLVELRLDALPELDLAAAREALARTRQAIGPQRPLLATVRTRAEGGLTDLPPERYAALLEALCVDRAADLVDLELSAGPEILRRVTGAARQAGVVTVISSHDFSATPETGEMAARLNRMADWGDVAKLAVMPRCPADAARLLEATALAAQTRPDTPLITMAMGPLGAVTRVCGAAFGCCAGFASAGVSSAPGQPAAEALRAALSALPGCGV